MALDLLKKSRWLTIASMLALASVSTVGCAADTAEDGSSDGDEGSSVDDITQVSHSKVKRQSIGNCWLYANTSWLEALNKAATGVEKNTSESWLTYWHWYEQLANGSARTEISTGGSFGTGADLINRYGIMLEGDFIAGEAEAEMSARQSSALAAVNEGLKSGALKDAVAARNKKAIRKELDRAWGLDAGMITRINAVFGEGVTRTLDRSSYASGRAASNKVIRAKDFPVQVKDPTTGQKVTATLQDAIGKSAGFWGPREGKYAWNEVDYPSSPTERRSFWKRVLKRIDVTSRSLVAVIEPGSCFAGTLAEIAFACDRAYMFDGTMKGDNRPAATVTLSHLNFGQYPMSNGITRLETRFLGEPESVGKAKAATGKPLDGTDADRLGLVTEAYDEVDYADEVRIFLEERASYSADGLTGLEANLRFGGPETMETKIFGRLTAWQNWIFQRPNAVGADGALKRYGSGVKADFNPERV